VAPKRTRRDASTPKTHLQDRVRKHQLR